MKKILLSVLVLLILTAAFMFFKNSQLANLENSTSTSTTVIQPPPGVDKNAPPEDKTKIAKLPPQAQRFEEYLKTLPPEARQREVLAHEIQPEPLPYDSLNKNNCASEIYKAALYSFQTQRFSGFGTTMYCINQVYKVTDLQRKHYFDFFTAAAKHEKSYKLNGTEIIIDEAHLKDLIKSNP